MAERKRMRMAELAKVSGVSRETIHYYLREGLLPRPVKGGKTVAYYDESHLERLTLIRRLREEKYLPLAVIRRIVEAGPEGPTDRDVDTLSDVLSIDPTFRRSLAELATPDSESERIALELGLLGESVTQVSKNDPTEQRVLASVAQALSLEGDARQLTLDDMRACAQELSRLVDLEAGLFFDLVIRRGDMPSSIAALRSGRAAVARFITAYRDLMLRRVVDDVLSAINQGTRDLEQLDYLELSEGEMTRLGAPVQRKEFQQRALAGDAAAANDLVWHLFVLGTADDLSGLSPKVLELLRPRARFLVAAARAEHDPIAERDALAAQLDKSGSFSLGQVLVAQIRLASFAREKRSDQGFLELAVPVLHDLACATPDQDADPLASACAFHRRGLIRLALPRVLGRHGRALEDLERALGVVLAAPGRISAASRARLEGNIRLSLGRLLLEMSRNTQAGEHLERARAIDPSGPIGVSAKKEQRRIARR
ncbi:MAG: MerR family transcriptional regulator [Polyangiaceae bacterium]